MTFRTGLGIVALACLALGCVSPLSAQQKGQYVPGQFGLNAGVIPDPGITYGNLVVNYSAGQLNNSNGNPIKGVTGTYSFWVDENVFYYVPKHKFLGGYFMPYIVLSGATGDLVAAIPALNLSAGAGGSGFADLYVQPLNLGWHLKRADVNAGYGFTAPTGRYSSAPGTTNNVGSGYWGNDLTTNTTFYLTKSKGTSANLATVYEIHGQKQITNIKTGLPVNVTPGQAFTMEWGFGQVIPLKKDFSRLAQFGLVGYDQWQVTSNGGSTTLGTQASAIPYYSVHAIGAQANFILPAKDLSFFFKYYDEFRAKAHPEGRTFVFGFSWTLRIPKPEPEPAKQ
jgi:hypothetical protein